MIIHGGQGNAPENSHLTRGYAPAAASATRYGPGEITRRLALCGLLIDRKRHVIFTRAGVDCKGSEARALGRDIAALGRLQRTWRRLHALAEYPVLELER